jgi:hypothetical protein
MSIGFLQERISERENEGWISIYDNNPEKELPLRVPGNRKSNHYRVTGVQRGTPRFIAFCVSVYLW